MVKKALAVALGCGSLIFLLCSFLLYVTPFDADRRSAIAYALVLVLQIALIVSTVAAYYSMKREPHDLQILATRLWVPIVGIAAAAIVVPNIFMQERAPNEAYSVGSLRTINTAQVYYSQTHPEKGFATSLTELGPEPGAALIDPVLASGRKSGYVFVLTAASPDSHGRISHYSVIARPQRYGREGKYSFFTDESGVLHLTTEDRAPTAQGSCPPVGQRCGYGITDELFKEWNSIGGVLQVIEFRSSKPNVGRYILRRLARD